MFVSTDIFDKGPMDAINVMLCYHMHVVSYTVSFAVNVMIHLN